MSHFASRPRVRTGVPEAREVRSGSEPSRFGNEAGMSFRFREIDLVAARSIKDLGPSSAASRSQLGEADSWRRAALRAKPECPLDSERLASRLHDRSRIGTELGTSRPQLGEANVGSEPRYEQSR